MSNDRRERRLFAKLLERDGDRCSVCHTPFASDAVTATAIGYTAAGAAAVVGHCCIDQLTRFVALGTYRPFSAKLLGRDDTAWKADDREWFAAHPQRAHRLRPSFAGEVPPGPDFVPPPHHEVQILVRQEKPGRRVRAAIFRDLRCPIPEIEPVLHAMFDIYTSRPAGTPVTAAEVAALASKYEGAGRA